MDATHEPPSLATEILDAKDAMVRDGRLDEGISLLSRPFTRTELAVRMRQALEASPPTAPPRDDGG